MVQIRKAYTRLEDKNKISPLTICIKLYRLLTIKMEISSFRSPIPHGKHTKKKRD